MQQGGHRTSRLFMQDAWRPDLYYHVIGKAVPGELLFRDERDYRRFLRKNLRDRYGIIFQVYVYCLLPNHYHLVVRTRTRGEIAERLGALRRRLKRYERAFLAGESTWTTFVQAVFRAAPSSYAQYYNRRYGRDAQLFVKPTLHGLTDKGAPGVEFSKTLAAYVGLNFYKHGLAPADANYPWSSLTAPKYHIIEPDIELHYGSEEAYRAFHLHYLKKYGARLLAFDEEAFFANLRPREYFEDIGEWREVEARGGGGGGGGG